MELNSNTWYIKFYLFLHQKSKYGLPKDICTLRNELIKTFILFIFIWPFWLAYAAMESYAGNDTINPWKLLGVNFILNMISLVAIIKLLGEPIAMSHITTIFISNWFLGPLLLGVSFFVIAFTMYLIVIGIGKLYKEYLKPEKKPKQKNPNVIKTMYKSWREKYCTKITWK